MAKKVRPKIMFIDADPQLKASLQLLFTKLGVHAVHAEPMQAVGKLMSNSDYDLIIWRCGSRTKQNQRILFQLGEIRKKHNSNILVLCDKSLFKEMKGVGLRQCLPLPFKGMAFYQKVRDIVSVPLLMPEKYASFMESQEFFNNISNDTLVMLLHYGSFEEVELGGIILKEGTATDRIFLLMGGSIQVVLPQKHDQVAHTMSAGSCFGEGSLVPGETQTPRLTRIVAEEKSTVFSFPVSELGKLEEHMQLEIYKEFTLTLSKKILNFVKVFMVG